MIDISTLQAQVAGRAAVAPAKTMDSGASANPEAGSSLTVAESQSAQIEEMRRGIDYMFALEMVKAMRAAKLDEGADSGLGSSSYMDMMNDSLANSLASGNGLGLGAWMVRQLASAAEFSDAGASATLPGSPITAPERNTTTSSDTGL